jgi:hypothetical protein
MFPDHQNIWYMVLTKGYHEKLTGQPGGLEDIRQFAVSQQSGKSVIRVRRSRGKDRVKYIR